MTKTPGQVDDYQTACETGVFVCMSDELCMVRHDLSECNECKDYYDTIKRHVIAAARPQSMSTTGHISVHQMAASSEPVYFTVEQVNQCIDHARPQIEAEARAVGVRDAIMHFVSKGAIDAALKRADEFAAMPPTHQVVPLEPTEAMLKAAMEREDDEPLTEWGKIVPASHAEIYKAMLAASKGRKK